MRATRLHADNDPAYNVLVPFKAAVMNLLSIGAAYGVVVAVFQWGWARS